MDIQVGKNKYKVTATLLLTVGAIIVSAVSWFTMLQVDISAMQKDIENLKAEVEHLEKRLEQTNNEIKMKQDRETYWKFYPQPNIESQELIIEGIADNDG